MAGDKQQNQTKSVTAPDTTDQINSLTEEVSKFKKCVGWLAILSAIAGSGGVFGVVRQSWEAVEAELKRRAMNGN